MDPDGRNHSARGVGASAVGSGPGLHDLPVEILYEVHLYTASSHLPHVSRRLHNVLRSAPPTIHARYILCVFDAKHRQDQESNSSGSQSQVRTPPSLQSLGQRLSGIGQVPSATSFTPLHQPHPQDTQAWPIHDSPVPVPAPIPPSTLLNFVISFPLCNQDILEAIVRISRILQNIPPAPATLPGPPNRARPYVSRRNLDETLLSLPKRPFRVLHTASASQRQAQLSYTQYIYTLASELGLKVRTNAHEGYALIWAVQALDLPLIELLLEKGADPGRKKALAVQIAILKGDVEIVKLLVEAMQNFGRGPGEPVAGSTKGQEKLKLGDLLLSRAVRCKATEIVDWLVSEKGCVPNAQILEMCATGQ